jgi:tetratricopeptide (TPR) repeat protein
LCGLAGRQQLVCAEDTFQAAGGEDAFPNSSKKLDRFVKGFDVPVAMRVVLPEGHACEDLRLIGHRRETRPENLDLLNAARKALEKGDFVDEEKSFRELVRKEPGNFEANFRLAERLLIRQPKKGETPSGNITKASEHLRTARQINPDAWRVWFLASAARRSKFANSRDYADLDRAITHAEEALKKATEFVDADGMDQTKLVLAGLLLDRSKDPERDGADDLARAAEYCNDIEKAFDGVQTRRKSDRLVFTAMVQLAQGGEPRNTIRKMLDEAIGIDTNNANAHRALAEFLEGGDGSDSGTSPVSG